MTGHPVAAQDGTAPFLWTPPGATTRVPLKIRENNLMSHGTIYISGPMTGYEFFNFPAFRAAEQKLKDAGWVNIENPTKNTEGDDQAPGARTWEWYMRRAIVQLMKCDTILMLDGWSHSQGACIEYKLATDLNMNVLFEREI